MTHQTSEDVPPAKRPKPGRTTAQLPDQAGPSGAAAAPTPETVTGQVGVTRQAGTVTGETGVTGQAGPSQDPAPGSEEASLQQIREEEARVRNFGDARIQTMNLEEMRAVLEQLNQDHPLLMGPYLGLASADPNTSGPSPGVQRTPPPTFCHCGQCCALATEPRQVCCRPNQGPCVTEDSSFRDLCTRPNVIHVAGILNYGSRFGRRLMDFSPSTYRNQADRFYILWKHGILGAGRRVQIPNCVLARIRWQFPDPNAQYTGFRPARK